MQIFDQDFESHAAMEEHGFSIWFACPYCLCVMSAAFVFLFPFAFSLFLTLRIDCFVAPVFLFPKHVSMYSRSPHRLFFTVPGLSSLHVYLAGFFFFLLPYISQLLAFSENYAYLPQDTKD